MLDGNFGRAVIKTSAVKHEHRFVEAPARVFTDQAELHRRLQARRTAPRLRRRRDLPGSQGQRHAGTAQADASRWACFRTMGFHVALVTDGRMSGASGKVPAAIHVTPEAASRRPMARVRDGDIVRLDAEKGTLEVLVMRIWPRANPSARSDRQPLRHRPRPVRRLPRPGRRRRGRRFGLQYSHPPVETKNASQE